MNGRMTIFAVDDEAQICVEAIGDRGDPAILPIAAAAWSMDWWEPGYTRTDMIADAVALLDEPGIERAHVAGLSMGGGIAPRRRSPTRTRSPTGPTATPVVEYIVEGERAYALVLHGTADPMFPPAHGRALADAIPGARLIELDDVGHQLPPPHTWPLLVDTLVAHTRAA